MYKKNLKPVIENSASDTKAYDDRAFMHSQYSRTLRLQAEYLKPEIAMEHYHINSTIVVFGSARTLPPEKAEANLAAARAALAEQPESRELQQSLRLAESQVRESRYYTMAQELGQLVGRYDRNSEDGYDFVVVTGGGGGIMEAGNRGASEAGGITVGFNITLPFEQHPNPYITPNLNFNLHYFCIRKMHFLQRAKALGCFPGGFGTMDELFEALTLIQTGKIPAIPVILFGTEYWEKIINWDFFVERGLISPQDLGLIRFCDSAEEGWDIIRRFHNL